MKIPLKEEVEEAELLLCAVTGGLLENPVTYEKCGHSFTNHESLPNACPICRTVSNTKPNTHLRNIVAALDSQSLEELIALCDEKNKLGNDQKSKYYKFYVAPVKDFFEKKLIENIEKNPTNLDSITKTIKKNKKFFQEKIFEKIVGDLSKDIKILLEVFLLDPKLIDNAPINILKSHKFISELNDKKYGILVGKIVEKFKHTEILKDFLPNYVKNNSDNAEILLAVLSCHGDLLEFVTDELKKNEEIIYAAIKNSIKAVEFVPEEYLKQENFWKVVKKHTLFKSSKHAMSQAIQYDPDFSPYIFFSATEELQQDKALIKLLLQFYPEQIRHMPEKIWSNQEICNNTVLKNALQKLDNPDYIAKCIDKILEEKETGENLDEIIDIMLEKIQRRASFIDSVPKKIKDRPALWNQLFKANFFHQSPVLIKEAIKYIKFTKEETQVFLENSNILLNTFLLDPELIDKTPIEILKSDEFLQALNDKRYRKLVGKIVIKFKDTEILKDFLPNYVKNNSTNKEILLEILKYHGNLLEVINSNLKEDSEILYTAITNNHEAIKFVPEECLKKNKFWKYFEDKGLLQGSKILMAKAIQCHPDARIFFSATKELQKDEYLIKLTLWLHPEQIRYMPEEVWNNQEICNNTVLKDALQKFDNPLYIQKCVDKILEKEDTDENWGEIIDIMLKRIQARCSFIESIPKKIKNKPDLWNQLYNKGLLQESEVLITSAINYNFLIDNKSIFFSATKEIQQNEELINLVLSKNIDWIIYMGDSIWNNSKIVDEAFVGQIVKSSDSTEVLLKCLNYYLKRDDLDKSFEKYVCEILLIIKKHPAYIHHIPEIIKKKSELWKKLHKNSFYQSTIVIQEAMQYIKFTEDDYIKAVKIDGMLLNKIPPDKINHKIAYTAIKQNNSIVFYPSIQNLLDKNEINKSTILKLIPNIENTRDIALCEVNKFTDKIYICEKTIALINDPTSTVKILRELLIEINNSLAEIKNQEKESTEKKTTNLFSLSQYFLSPENPKKKELEKNKKKIMTFLEKYDKINQKNNLGVI